MYRIRPDDHDNLQDADAHATEAEAAFAPLMDQLALRPNGLPRSVDRIFDALDKMSHGVAAARRELDEI